MKKYFQLISLINGHGFQEVIPDENTDPDVYLSAENEDEFIEKLNLYASQYSHDFEVIASFDDGCGDIWYNNPTFIDEGILKRLWKL